MPTSPISMLMNAWLVLALPAGLFTWRIIAARRERDRQALAAGPAPDDARATEFPVRGISTRGGFLMGGVSKNSINPNFRIEAGGLRMRILKTWRLPFGDLKQVDARTTIGGVALIFHSAAERRVFIVRFADAALARSALSRVTPSAPLTEDAAILRDGHAGGATRGLSRYDGPLG
jgi:hypothetical protein